MDYATPSTARKTQACPCRFRRVMPSTWPFLIICAASIPWITAPSRCCRPRSLHRAQPPLNVPVIGFDPVIAVAASSLSAPRHNATLALKFPDRRRIAPQATSGEYTRSSVVRVGQCLLQEQLGCLTITSFREVEIDSLAIAVYGAEQVHPFSGDANESLIQVPSGRLPFNLACKRPLSSGPYVCTHRQMDVWSTAKPRSAMSSSRSRKLKQNRTVENPHYIGISGVGGIT
jgi:hypothetical protein